MDMAQGDIPTRVLLASDDPAAEADIKGAFVDGAPSTVSEPNLHGGSHCGGVSLAGQGCLKGRSACCESTIPASVRPACR